MVQGAVLGAAPRKGGASNPEHPGTVALAPVRAPVRRIRPSASVQGQLGSSDVQSVNPTWYPGLVGSVSGTLRPGYTWFTRCGIQ